MVSGKLNSLDTSCARARGTRDRCIGGDCEYYMTDRYIGGDCYMTDRCIGSDCDCYMCHLHRTGAPWIPRMGGLRGL